jgi:hypothetical protein
MEKQLTRLPDEISKKYDVLPGKPLKFVHPEFGYIDLTKATKKQADALVKRGLKTLVPKPSKKEK